MQMNIFKVLFMYFYNNIINYNVINPFYNNIIYYNVIIHPYYRMIRHRDNSLYLKRYCEMIYNNLKEDKITCSYCKGGGYFTCYYCENGCWRCNYTTLLKCFVCSGTGEGRYAYSK